MYRYIVLYSVSANHSRALFAVVKRIFVMTYALISAGGLAEELSSASEKAAFWRHATLGSIFKRFSNAIALTVFCEVRARWPDVLTRGPCGGSG
jgi:hypothetical protein